MVEPAAQSRYRPGTTSSSVKRQHLKRAQWPVRGIEIRAGDAAPASVADSPSDPRLVDLPALRRVFRHALRVPGIRGVSAHHQGTSKRTAAASTGSPALALLLWIGK